MLTINNEEHMFEQKYRPATIEECILPTVDKQIFLNLVKTGKIPHLILHSSSPGTGKTTVARALAHDVDAEMMFVNGSDCKLDFIRNELTRFASSKSLSGKQKIIIIDEFDRSGLGEAQKHLRAFMEAFSKNCSVIITANDINGIHTALHSRARVIHFGQPSPDDVPVMQKAMLMRLKAICDNEGLEIEDMKVLAALVKKNFPEFRKTVNQLDHYSKSGKIDAGILSVILQTRGSIEEVISALKDKNVKELRALAPKYASDYSNFIGNLAKELYDKVTGPSILRMYEICGENNQYHGIAANVELHVQYMFVQLAVEMQWK
ncbi:putative replication factor C small subunit [Serratia phage 4S]|nr:putative replication factor C small subunit [Serratia phage 4S]